MQVKFNLGLMEIYFVYADENVHGDQDLAL